MATRSVPSARRTRSFGTRNVSRPEGEIATRTRKIPHFTIARIAPSSVVVAPGSSKPQMMTALERHLLAVRARQHRAILLLDEAQNLDRDLLEEAGVPLPQEGWTWEDLLAAARQR